MESMSTKTLFDEQRMTWPESLELTAQSLTAWGSTHRHWAIAWSGGKDSTALLTIVLYLLEAGIVAAPERLTICYADTRMELPPLALAAQSIIAQLKSRGIEVRIAVAEMDKRYFVYMLGRGIPPPNNNTFRWCTRQIKVDPMADELRRLVGESQGGRILMLTGVRIGESASRDARIAMRCGKNGAECGQGWYQEMTGDGFSTLAPILHMRVCQVWDWLKAMAPLKRYGGWRTAILADAYGGEEAEEINARTGCVGCPLANVDTALDAVLRVPEWLHIEPLKELRPIYRELREPRNRLRMPAGESRKDGTLSPNQCRMGPLTMEARRWALDAILMIQWRCNEAALRFGREPIDILNNEEVRRIRELHANNTWPNKWTGTEPRADEPFKDPSIDQSPMLFDEESFA